MSPARRRRRDIVEITIGYGLVLVVLWTPRPWQQAFFFITAIFLVFAFLRSWPGRDEMGLRVANLMRSIWIALVAVAFAASAIAIAASLHTLKWPGGLVPFLHRYLGYAIWAFFQQVLLQGFFLFRFRRLMGAPWSAALAAAGLFALAHLPNPTLTIATIIWGLGSCLLFLRYRNLYPLALAHAILGITIAITIPGSITRNMRVGLGYIAYGRQAHHLSH